MFVLDASQEAQGQVSVLSNVQNLLTCLNHIEGYHHLALMYTLLLVFLFVFGKCILLKIFAKSEPYLPGILLSAKPELLFLCAQV